MNLPRKEAIIEGAKEFLRLMLVTLVSAAIVFAQAKVGLVTDPGWQAVAVFVLASLGKGIDKFVHKDPSINANGIVPF